VTVQTIVAQEELTAWTDDRLVHECLDGNEDAWCALVDKYKNLIFSVPIKYGFSRDEAADIFQMVCLEILSQLDKLREPRALPKWILMVTSHKCYHVKHQFRRNMEKAALAGEHFEEGVPSQTEEILRQAEQEQHLREALDSLPERCRALIRMLFFEEPARPYQQIAGILGLATGSIGFIRHRCLHRLRKKIDEMGFR
jgi:RNA polymerase sigma factor (sigma-70 family)